MNGAVTQPLSICTAAMTLLADTGTYVLWPCSKPLGALLSMGPLAYDTFLCNAPSHCLSQFLVQVTAHPHPLFGLSELKRCPQHRILLSSMFKASTPLLSLPSQLGHAPPKNPQSLTVFQLLP